MKWVGVIVYMFGGITRSLMERSAFPLLNFFNSLDTTWNYDDQYSSFSFTGTKMKLDTGLCVSGGGEITASCKFYVRTKWMILMRHSNYLILRMFRGGLFSGDINLLISEFSVIFFLENIFFSFCGKTAIILCSNTCVALAVLIWVK